MPSITAGALYWAERYAKDNGYELSVQDDRLCLANIKVPGDQFEARHIETILRHLHAKLRQARADMVRDKPRAIACYLYGPSEAGGVRTMHDDDRVAMTGREAEVLIVAGAGGWGEADIMEDGQVIKADPMDAEKLARLALAQSEAWQVGRHLREALPPGSDVKVGWCEVNATTPDGRALLIETFGGEGSSEFDVMIGSPLRKVGTYSTAKLAAAAAAAKLAE